MADIVVTTGRVLEAAALQSFLDTLTLRLYVNSVSVTVLTTLGALTEASFPGYSAVAVSSWGTAFLNGSNQGEIDEIIRGFTLSASGGPYSIYGYYLTAPGPVLYAVGPNAGGPVSLSQAGDTYQVLPKKVQGDLC